MIGVQDVQQLEGRMNQIWIGSYKLRVKVAIDRGQNGRGYQKTAERSGRIREQSFVKPGRTYVQAVKESSARSVGAQVWRKTVGVQEREEPVDKASIALGKPLEFEAVRSGEKVGGAIVEESTERIIDFSPSKEENKWLEGSVVAVVRSMSMISNIQERVDIDGGLINLSPLGGRSVLLTERVEGYLSEYIQHNSESFPVWCEVIYPWDMAPLNNCRMVWLRISGVPLKAWSDRCFEWIADTVGEVVMLHADTKSKAILCDGRVLVLCAEKHKVSKTIKLKVVEKMYEITVMEEEWRADPDWWLGDDDRNGEASSGSEYSSSDDGEEDSEVMASVIRGDDEADIEDELMQEKDILNLNVEEVTAAKKWDREEGTGLPTESSLRLDSMCGSKEGAGPVVRESKRQALGGLGANIEAGMTGDQNGVSDGELNKIVNLGIRDSREKKRRNVKDCYAQLQASNFAAGSMGMKGRVSLRSHRVQQQSATQQQLMVTQ
ncbi:hypothetical protein SLE2022_169040 [Rubroshorea leprosula]